MDNRAIIDITVSPKSSRNRISVDTDNNIKIYLTAPPVDGRANTELVQLLSKTLNVPKSSIEILHGESGRKKRLAIAGRELSDVIKLLRS